MKYDDAEYFFLNFETDLDNNAANTHSGMFLAWAVLRGLARNDPSDEHWNREAERLKRREITGGDFLADLCDCKLMDQDLSEEGNAFAAHYYDASFGKDYAAVLGDQMPSTGHDADDFCSVPDTWANFDKLARLLDKRYGDWKAKTGPAGGSGGPPPKPASGGGAAKPLELSLEPMEGEEPAPPPPPPAPTSSANGEPLESLESLQKRAAAGDGEAWYQLGAEHITGERTPRDFKKAADAFEKAAQQGIAQAAFNLAVCYQNGDGRPQDPKQMLRWFALAAEGGHGPSAYYLAMAYRQGQHLQQDFVASNALMLLARGRGVKEAAEAGVMAGSMTESAALAMRLQEPGQLVATLSARRRALAAGKVESGVERWRDPAGTSGSSGGSASAGGSASGTTVPATEPSGSSRNSGSTGTKPKSSGSSSRTSDSSRSSRTPSATRSGDKPSAQGFGMGHVALLIGAVALVPLLMSTGSSLTGNKLKALATALGLVGAFGVFVVTGVLRRPMPVRLLLTVLAALPFVGSLACILVVLNWVRTRTQA